MLVIFVSDLSEDDVNYATSFVVSSFSYLSVLRSEKSKRMDLSQFDFLLPDDRILLFRIEERLTRGLSCCPFRLTPLTNLSLRSNDQLFSQVNRILKLWDCLVELHHPTTVVKHFFTWLTHELVCRNGVRVEVCWETFNAIPDFIVSWD